jgi:uncharacterized protein
MSPATIPLFPLNTVLFPGGRLRLRIFEPRYLGMVGRCLRESVGFGIALIVEGQEAGGPARTVAVGTYAHIVDFEQREDGLLGITAEGERRFRISSVHRAADGLDLAQVDWLPPESAQPVAVQYRPLVQLLERGLEQGSAQRGEVATRGGDATWLGMRLAENLPLPQALRQELLEINDAQARLARLQALLVAHGKDA